MSRSPVKNLRRVTLNSTATVNSKLRLRDPYLDIAQATGFADYRIEGNPIEGDQIEGNRIPVIIELVPHESFAALAAELGTAGQLEAAYESFSNDFSYVTAKVTPPGLKILQNSVHVARFELAAQLRAARMPARRPPLEDGTGDTTRTSGKSGAQPEERQRKKVLLAMIDTGCPFAHPLLRERDPPGGPGRTRVRALWDQDDAPDFAEFSESPTGFSYGAVAHRHHLDNAIAAAQGDQKRCYELVGYREMKRLGSHGSHSLGLMLGYGQSPGYGQSQASRQPQTYQTYQAYQAYQTQNGDEPDIVFVQLPRPLLFTPSKAVLARYLLDGLIWIASQRRDGEELIISIGRGSPLGPHDGSSIMETAIDQFTRLMADHLKGIYIAAGNEFDSELHFEVTAAQFDATPIPNETRLTSVCSAEMLWRVLPGSEVPAIMELWLPTDDTGSVDIDIRLQSPDGQVVLTIQPDTHAFWPSAKACIAAASFVHWQGDRSRLCLLRLAPSKAFGLAPGCPAGDWKLTLSAKRPLPGSAHAYIGRVTPTFGYPTRGQQSHFVNRTAGKTRAQNAKGTLQGLATAHGVYSIGGYVGDPKYQRPAHYTSAGPSRNNLLPGPFASVMTDNGSMLRGRRSIGNLGGATFRMDGTSVAAPLAAYHVHRQSQSGIAPVELPSNDRTRLGAYLIRDR